MNDITGKLNDVRFSLRCDLPMLHDYARQHLAPLCDSVGTPQVAASLRWHNGQPPMRQIRRDPALASMQRVDRDLYVDGGALRWFRVDDLRDLHLSIRYDEHRLEVEGNFYYRLGNSRLSDRIRRMRQWRNLDLMRQRRFPTLLAYLVYYPCWWWIEQSLGWHPIHAAGVETPRGVVLLAGASGVGKSTLAVALAGEDGCSLLADSFVLQRGVDILPVREPILLDDWSREWLGDRARHLQPMGRRFGLRRHGFHYATNRLSQGGQATMLVFPRRAVKSFVREVPSEQAHGWLSAGNLMVNDLRRYFAYGAILEQVHPCGLMAQRENEMANLTASVRCMEVGIAPDMTCAEAVRIVLDSAGTTRPLAGGALGARG